MNYTNYLESKNHCIFLSKAERNASIKGALPIRVADPVGADPKPNQTLEIKPDPEPVVKKTGSGSDLIEVIIIFLLNPNSIGRGGGSLHYGSLKAPIIKKCT